MEHSAADALLQELTQTDDLAACLRRNEALFRKETVAQGLSALFRTRKLSKAELARRSDVSLVFLHQVFAGRRTPSRDRLLGLCFGLEASLEETQDLLLRTPYAALNPRNRRDAIVIHALTHRRSVPELEALLARFGEAPLY